jgi:hypothetical protein
MATTSKPSSNKTLAIGDRTLTQQLHDEEMSAALARLGKG